jgi:dihydroorotase-like cyclic amidohydrolase
LQLTSDLYTREEKASTDYLVATAGLPRVQDALLSMLELYHDGIIPIEDTDALPGNFE